MNSIRTNNKLTIGWVGELHIGVLQNTARWARQRRHRRETTEKEEEGGGEGSAVHEIIL
jgi:hypothetical protein